MTGCTCISVFKFIRGIDPKNSIYEIAKPIKLEFINKKDLDYKYQPTLEVEEVESTLEDQDNYKSKYEELKRNSEKEIKWLQSQLSIALNKEQLHDK